MKQDDIRLTPISNGTVLDHLPAGTALKIIEVLCIKNPIQSVTIAINTESKRLGRKDLVFIEGRELSEKEYEKLGLIAKGATVNIVRNSKVEKKTMLAFTKEATGLFECLNPKCITTIEELPSKFDLREKPFRAKCLYCGKSMNEEDVLKSIK